ncbi:MAG: UDP-N-acetylmuramate dehydrogenase [Lachnospiraceae bacterium]|nr:UDP-N-acetylmuramate dehydrogenase [Lachnospiraceae bacterium]
MNKDIFDLIGDILPKERIRKNEPMNVHTTFRTGGNADLFLMPENASQLSKLIKCFRDEKEDFFIIGNGSNLLVSDRGFRGVIIQITENFSGTEVKDLEIKAGAGALLSKIADTALKNSLTGFEFASGIPGTAGGAMVMNAGAYGGEMKDVVKEVEVLDREGSYLTLQNEDMDFSYRNSAVREKGYIVLNVTFSLEKGDSESISSKMKELAEKRREKQPLEYPSAGSTFKRPEGNFAGKLIMEAGLRGFTIGGARVSEKHCGFVVNAGGATSDDIYNLIKEVQQKVRENSGIMLEPEVLMIGEF